MLPILLPMSLLFSIILTYGRLSADSEIVAMKASGMHMGMLLLPAMVLSILVGVLSAQTSFNIAPWGNRQFELIYRKIGSMKAGIALKEGTFAEGFFDKVIYAGEVDSKKGLLRKVFIYDESSGETPLTVIAKGGQIMPDPDAPGHSVLLRLTDGDIHRKGLSHTKINFDSYDIQLSEPIPVDNSEKSPQSLTLEEVQQKLNQTVPEENRRILETEFHKRWATSILCIVFGLIGVGLGTTTNRRSAKAGGMILCVGLIIVYWILYVAAEGAARSGAMPVAIALWLPNIIYGIFGLESLRRNWN
jgi:lipopolysaccharide export system permease protein